MPEDRVRGNMLLDFYGDLLTARQRECYELHFNEDLSLSEIAEQCGISRQGAWDNIRRAADTMENLEAKTGLIARTLDTDRHLRHLKELLDRMAARLEAEAVGDRATRGGAGAEKLPRREAAPEEDRDARSLLQEAREELFALLKTED